MEGSPTDWIVTGIDEGDGYGGFPVSGQWLICNKPELIEQHQAKVYGKFLGRE